MIVATWNVNSIRSRLDATLRWLAMRQPDVLCLQEARVAPREFPALAFAALGYLSAFHCEGQYNGVAILSRLPITDVTLGMGDGVPDPEARLISATVAGVRVICAYAPHGRDIGHDYWRYKLTWLARLRRHLDARYRREDLVLLAGDLNVATEARDVHDVAYWSKHVHFHPDARVALRDVAAFGFVDLLRMHHAGAGLYTWWDYKTRNAFEKNKGLRIDHLWATEPLAKRCVYSAIDRGERALPHASDHAPVIAAFG